VLNVVVMNVINNYYECREVIVNIVKEEKKGNKKKEQKNYMRKYIVKSHVSRVKLKFSTSLRLLQT